MTASHAATLWQTIEVDSNYAEKVASRCQEIGLRLTTSGNAITMFPPLNIARKVALEGLKILECCSSKV